ncbi:ECF transporter S component [Mycoplasmopsis edwardii]|uniref:ECF transporter S component n=1 Tax=Mycoplasmopsis edwardii TaxID=53558 RepID=A0ACD4PJY6_9BACT|nr:ECF transporter S component [Mycoplasmopsis edwardii]WBP84101.1 ECF transporter S component [Mycoplasmopsis edwardii]
MNITYNLRKPQIKTTLIANLLLSITSIFYLVVAILNQVGAINLFNPQSFIQNSIMISMTWIIFVLIIATKVFLNLKEKNLWGNLLSNIDIERKKFFKVSWINISFNLVYFELYRLIFLASVFEEDGNVVSNLKVSLRKNKIMFSVYEISLAGVLLCLFFILTAVKNYTPLRIVGIDFEFIFYIIFAFFFGKFKGALLSFIADFFSLLLAGRIGFYHEAYAIVPIVMTILIGLFLDLFKKHQKVSIVIMEIALLIVFAVLAYVFVLNINDPKGIKISKTFGLSRLSLGVFITLLVLSFSIFIVFNIFIFRFIKTKDDKKKERLSYILLSIFLVVFVIVLARWIWGPYAFIQYANRYLGKFYSLEERYLLIMVPIILRSVIILPIYILIISSILPVLIFLKKTIVKDVSYY